MVQRQSMGLVNKIVNHFTGKNLRTVIHPSTKVTNEVTLSTNPTYNLHAYVLPVSKLMMNGENTFVVNLKRESNIKDIPKIIDSFSKRVKGDKLESFGKSVKKTVWVDRFNRFIGAQLEEPDGIAVTIRGDVAQQLFMEGHLLVQCTTAACDAMLPTTMNVDLGKFGTKDPKKLKRKDGGTSRF
jgi:hypothetical protein